MHIDHLHQNIGRQTYRLARAKGDLGAALPVHLEPTTQGEQLELAAASTHQSVRLAHATIIEPQSRRGESAQDSADSTRMNTANYGALHDVDGGQAKGDAYPAAAGEI